MDRPFLFLVNERIVWYGSDSEILMTNVQYSIWRSNDVKISNTKSSMLYNLLSVNEAQMLLLDVVLDKNPVQYVSVSQYISALLHW